MINPKLMAYYELKIGIIRQHADRVRNSLEMLESRIDIDNISADDLGKSIPEILDTALDQYKIKIKRLQNSFENQLKASSQLIKEVIKEVIEEDSHDG